MNGNNEPLAVETPEVTKKSNKTLTIVGVVVGVLVIAAAAFIAGRFLNQRQAGGTGIMPAANIGGPGGMTIGGGSAVSMQIQVIPAPELPTTPPDVTGLLAERKDNSLFIGTFAMDTTGGGTGVVAISGSSSAADTGPAISVSGNSGPKVEVVVTNETKIYQDVTPFPTNPGEGTTSIQQTMAPGSLDDIGSMTMITVWGHKSGDRVIANVIAFTNPMIITNP